jgi:hypothetical protein
VGFEPTNGGFADLCQYSKCRMLISYFYVLCPCYAQPMIYLDIEGGHAKRFHSHQWQVVVPQGS